MIHPFSGAVGAVVVNDENFPPDLDRKSVV